MIRHGALINVYYLRNKQVENTIIFIEIGREIQLLPICHRYIKRF